jgi:CRISPR-associated protein Cas2
MAQQKLWYLVAYDSRDSKRLREVAKHMGGYGHRIQYSIFKCRLSNRELERLRWELAKIIDKEDDLLIIGLCAHCGERVAKLTGDERWAQPPASYEIV